MKATRLCLASLLALALFAAACISSGPAGTVRSFYRHVEAGEIEDALGLVSSLILDRLGKDKLRAALQEAARDIRDKGGIREIVIDKEEVLGEIATVTVTLHYGNGSHNTEEIELSREDGKWKLRPEK